MRDFFNNPMQIGDLVIFFTNTRDQIGVGRVLEKHNYYVLLDILTPTVVIDSVSTPI